MDSTGGSVIDDSRAAAHRSYVLQSELFRQLYPGDEIERAVTNVNLCIADDHTRYECELYMCYHVICMVSSCSIGLFGLLSSGKPLHKLTTLASDGYKY